MSTRHAWIVLAVAACRETPAPPPPPPPPEPPKVVAAPAPAPVPEEPPPAPPPASVRVAGFEIDRTEVSNGAYAECVAAKACKPPAWDDPKSAANLKTGKEENSAAYRALVRPTQPVVGVTWMDADAFCRWKGGRLPTIAEWSAAAGDGLYPWGNDPPDCTRARFAMLDNLRGKRCADETADVDSMPAGASPGGVLHLSGNVQEWVQDAKGEERGVRGGGWTSPADALRTAITEWMPPASRLPMIGFRCAR